MLSDGGTVGFGHGGVQALCARAFKGPEVLCQQVGGAREALAYVTLLAAGGTLFLSAVPSISKHPPSDSLAQEPSTSLPPARSGVWCSKMAHVALSTLNQKLQ